MSQIWGGLSQVGREALGAFYSYLETGLAESDVVGRVECVAVGGGDHAARDANFHGIGEPLFGVTEFVHLVGNDFQEDVRQSVAEEIHIDVGEDDFVALPFGDTELCEFVGLGDEGELEVGFGIEVLFEAAIGGRVQFEEVRFGAEFARGGDLGDDLPGTFHEDAILADSLPAGDVVEARVRSDQLDLLDLAKEVFAIAEAGAFEGGEDIQQAGEVFRLQAVEVVEVAVRAGQQAAPVRARGVVESGGKALEIELGALRQEDQQDGYEGVGFQFDAGNAGLLVLGRACADDDEAVGVSEIDVEYGDRSGSFPDCLDGGGGDSLAQEDVDFLFSKLVVTSIHDLDLYGTPRHGCNLLLTGTFNYMRRRDSEEAETA